jgi:hypothetical protein
VRRVGNVAAEDKSLAGLYVPDASDDSERGRFTNAFRPDQPDEATARQAQCDVVEGDRLAIDLGDLIKAGDRVLAPAHGGGLALSCGGQATRASVRT